MHFSCTVSLNYPFFYNFPRGRCQKCFCGIQPEGNIKNTYSQKAFDALQVVVHSPQLHHSLVNSQAGALYKEYRDIYIAPLTV